MMVRGHTCEGLERYQSRINYAGEPEPSYGCTPNFDGDGRTRGCDSTNYMPIVFCPFCGEKLDEFKGDPYERS